jgi:HECT-domain (ubiquitin-transferase)
VQLGGQKRAFKVKFVGEGVNDYSGPYREVFTDAFAEIMQADDEGHGFLGVLDATPNKVAGIGECRDLHMFSLNGQDNASLLMVKPSDAISSEEKRFYQSFVSLLATRDETIREVEEALVFLGRLAGTAHRHGIAVELPLPLQSVWNALVEDMTGSVESRLMELDVLATRLQYGKDSTSPSYSNPPLLWWQQRLLNAFAEGLSNVIPYEILPLMSGEELREVFCGNPEVDVDLLKRVVEYEGYSVDSTVVVHFWETLHEMTNDERKKLLQFVWARNRLPMRETDFETSFKLQRDASNTGDRADQALPSASTCFFSLTLPEYSTKEVLRNKLLFAINNVTTMETDFQTNSAEIAEGYRTF